MALVVTAIPAAVDKQTVGLFLNAEDACEGYTLFSPAYWYNTYLIDNEGLLVRSWESEYIPGLGGIAYLSNDGSLFRSIYIGAHPVLSGGGATGGVEKFDWDGNLVWHFEYSGDDYFPHHDIEVLPSGNVLMIVWEIKSNAEALEAGADKDALGYRALYPDHIIEVEPIGANGGNIVWEWHAWDHLVQDRNPALDNFGSVSDQPGLIDINARAFLISDFIHLNGVDYNEEFDQILLTAPMYNEIWVIDHSTTSEEASGHTGGKYGKGGDILYRWGNPRFYDHGTVDDQKLYGGHDANWVEPDCPGVGDIIIFNNGGSRNYSSIDEIDPPVDEEGNYQGGLPWGPTDPVWTYTAPNPYDFFVSIICGAQRLPNGNTLFSDAPGGEFFETTPGGDIVWHYINPVSDGGPVYQGDSIAFNSVFKMYRYPVDFPGFQGRDMTPGKPVERYTGDTIEPVAEIEPRIKLEIHPAFVTHSVNISYHLSKSGKASLKLYNALGQEVRTLVNEPKSSGCYDITWDGTDDHGLAVGPGVYFCRLESGNVNLKARILRLR